MLGLTAEEAEVAITVAAEEAFQVDIMQAQEEEEALQFL